MSRVFINPGCVTDRDRQTPGPAARAVCCNIYFFRRSDRSSSCSDSESESRIQIIIAAGAADILCSFFPKITIEADERSNLYRACYDIDIGKGSRHSSSRNYSDKQVCRTDISNSTQLTLPD